MKKRTSKPTVVFSIDESKAARSKHIIDLRLSLLCNIYDCKSDRQKNSCRILLKSSGEFCTHDVPPN